jgi:hypothetical protein
MSTGWIVFWLACMLLAGPITAALFHTVTFLWRCRWHIFQLTVFVAVAGYLINAPWQLVPLNEDQRVGQGMADVWFALFSALVATWIINQAIRFFRWLFSPKTRVKLPPKLTYAQRLALETAHLPPPRKRSSSSWLSSWAVWRPL